LRRKRRFGCGRVVLAHALVSGRRGSAFAAHGVVVPKGRCENSPVASSPGAKDAHTLPRSPGRTIERADQSQSSLQDSGSFRRRGVPRLKPLGYSQMSLRDRTACPTEDRFMLTKPTTHGPTQPRHDMGRKAVDGSRYRHRGRPPLATRPQGPLPQQLLPPRHVHRRRPLCGLLRVRGDPRRDATEGDRL